MRRRQQDIVFQKLDGRLVILDLRHSEYIEVNPSGTLLFHMLADAVEEEAMTIALQTRYGLDEATARRDVQQFVALLHEHDLLES